MQILQRKITIPLFILLLVLVLVSVFDTKTNSPGTIPPYDALRCTPSDAVLPSNAIGLAVFSPIDANAQTLIKELGLSLVRLEIRWDEVEVTPGTYDWKTVDDSVRFLKEHNIEILATINHPPVWSHQIQTLSNDFGTFLEVFTKRYLGKISYYEIFNEPNLPGYGWPFRTGVIEHDAKLYASVLTQANQSIRAHDPSGFIVLGGLSPDGYPPFEFLKHVYTNTSNKCFDILSYHPYGQSKRLLGVQDEFAQFVATMGDQNKPIWFAEFGTSDENLVLEVLNDVNQQASELQGLIWFSLRDLKPRGWNFGLVEYNWEKKPAFEKFKKIVDATK